MSYEDRVREALADVYTPAGVEIVMRSRNTGLGNHSPNELISAGLGAEVLDWATALADGNFA